MINKIKAEIERLLEENNKSEGVYDFGREHALKEVLSFIESLEKEQDNPYELKNVSHAAYEYERTRNDSDTKFDDEAIRRAFVAGAQWEKQKHRKEHNIDFEKEIDIFLYGSDNPVRYPETMQVRDEHTGLRVNDWKSWVNKPEYKIEFARHFYELGCRHAAVLYDDIEYERQRRQDNEPTIKGWVARDENGELWFHHLEPMRDGGKWNFGGGGFKMEEDIYPTLSWHDKPIEVELTIRKV